MLASSNVALVEFNQDCTLKIGSDLQKGIGST